MHRQQNSHVFVDGGVRLKNQLGLQTHLQNEQVIIFMQSARVYNAFPNFLSRLLTHNVKREVYSKYRGCSVFFLPKPYSNTNPFAALLTVCVRGNSKPCRKQELAGMLACFSTLLNRTLHNSYSYFSHVLSLTALVNAFTCRSNEIRSAHITRHA